MSLSNQNGVEDASGENQKEKTQSTAVQESIDIIALEQVFDSGYLELRDKHNVILMKKGYVNLLYKSSTEMHKLSFCIKDHFDFITFWSFMKEYGQLVRTLMISTETKLQLSIFLIFKYCMKLEHLSIESLSYENVGIYNYSEILELNGMSKLKSLKIKGYPVLKWISTLANCVDSLLELSIELDEISEKGNAILRSFILKQKCLKKFALEYQSAVVTVLPTNLDDIQFSLEEFKYSGPEVNPVSYAGFLKHCQRLKTLILGKNLPLDFLIQQQINDNNENVSNSQRNNSIEINSLQKLEDQRNITNALEVQIFRFIEILKVVSIIARQLTYLQLHTLEINYGTFNDLKDIFVPELKVLKIKTFPRCDRYFNDFMHSINSIEIFIIEALRCLDDIIPIVEILRFFPNLKTFNLIHRNAKDLYKIIIDKSQRTVIISWDVYEKCNGIMNVLATNFTHYEYKVVDVHNNISIKGILGFGREQNQLERFQPFTGYYFDLASNGIIKNDIITGNLKKLRIPDYPYDFNGGKVLKFLIENMNLQCLYIKNTNLILEGQKQPVNVISISSNQITSLFEMFRLFNRTLFSVDLTLSNKPIDSDEVERIVNSNTDIFANAQHLEVIDRSGNNGCLGIFVNLLKRFSNIFRLKIKTHDLNIDPFLRDFLPSMICLRKLGVDVSSADIRRILNTINGNARRLEKLHVNRQYVQDARKFFREHNQQVSVNQL